MPVLFLSVSRSETINKGNRGEGNSMKTSFDTQLWTHHLWYFLGRKHLPSGKNNPMFPFRH